MEKPSICAGVTVLLNGEDVTRQLRRVQFDMEAGNVMLATLTFFADITVDAKAIEVLLEPFTPTQEITEA